MTAFTSSTDLPSGINSLERLAAWTGLTLARINPTAKILEVPYADPERICQAFLVKADDGSNRLVLRLSIPLSDDYAVNTSQKLWMNALDISNTVIPSAFKTN
jgi:hypothetical protein